MERKQKFVSFTKCSTYSDFWSSKSPKNSLLDPKLLVIDLLSNSFPRGGIFSKYSRKDITHDDISREATFFFFFKVKQVAAEFSEFYYHFHAGEINHGRLYQRI